MIVGTVNDGGGKSMLVSIGKFPVVIVQDVIAVNENVFI
jgi:hypothetical protein